MFLEDLLVLGSGEVCVPYGSVIFPDMYFFFPKFVFILYVCSKD